MATYRNTAETILEDQEIFSQLDCSGLNYEEKVEFIVRILSINRSVTTRSRINSYKHLPDTYTVLDLETTGFSNFDEIIQFAALKIRDNKIVDNFETYIHPKRKSISKEISYLTGIDNSTVESSPTIDEVIPSIISFIGNNDIIGHNLSFDMRFLRNAGIDTDNYNIIDTLRLAQHRKLPVDNYKLPTLKEYFGIKNRSHNALNDCETTNILFQNLKKGTLPEIKKTEEIRSNCFDEMHFVITGSFKDIDRSKIKELITKCGGSVQTTVGKTTNILVEGIQTASNLKDGIHSSKHLKYIALKRNGYKIDYWDESKLLEVLKRENIYG